MCCSVFNLQKWPLGSANMVAKEKRKKRKGETDRMQIRSDKTLLTQFYCVQCKWTEKAPLNGQKKIGNHKRIVDTIHPSTLVLAL